MRIRIIKNVPAPLMDGFDVHGLRADQTYDVDARVGSYLIVAGYAVAVSEEKSEQEESPAQ